MAWRPRAGEAFTTLAGEDVTFAETAVILAELGRAMQLHGGWATPGKAASTCTSSAPRSTARYPARPWPAVRDWPGATAGVSMMRSGHRASEPGGHRPGRR
jgi:hypothetical protein